MTRRRMLPRTVTTALLSAGLLSAGLLGAIASAAEPLTGIHVTGAGEVTVVPDMARLSLEVRREGTDANRLKVELDEVVAAVLAYTDELDIARRDVTAAAVNIYPRYRPKDGESIIDGLIASRSIEIVLRDLTLIGDLINGALSRGVNGVGGVNLDAANRVELERRALDLAIDNAVREAQQIAERFDVRLGTLKNVVSGSHAVQPVMMDAMVMRSAAKESFSPGEMTVRRDVQATFGIRPSGDAN
jgi:uncharacterized protein